MNATLVEKINNFQLFILILLFNIGSAVVVGTGIEAGRDAWIAVLLTTFLGVAIIILYLYILSYEEGNHLFEIIDEIFGRLVAVIVTFMYVLYFLYIAARVLRDFMELLITAVLPNTPIEILTVTFMLSVIYIIYLGLEVLARTSEIFLPNILFSMFFISLFLFFGGNIKIDKLRPILADGFLPIVDAIFPSLMTFPFGEAIVLTFLLVAASQKEFVPKVSIAAVVASGIVLTYHTALKTSVLGVNLVERAAFPLLKATREISLFNFIERLDALIVFIMMLGIFIKVAIFFYGGLKGLEYIFTIPYRHFSVPVGMLVAFASVVIATNFTEHLEEGLHFVPYYLHLPFQFGIPILVALMIFWKKKKKGGQSNVKKVDKANEASGQT